ncbi:MAG: DNA replication/repair protein RecF [Actinomycetaceae bacterium]|nr:DNA replication/repair protein RecF [Actinomycetaceae bacterium]
MYVTDLALTDFRSYRQLLLQLAPGVTTFVGENGQGKTNIVEAITYLATLSSHRVSSDNALIRQGATAGVIRARVAQGQHSDTLEVEIYAGHANRARLNRGNVRPVELLGHMRAVLFAPEDLELVRGDPAARRSLLDDVMVQMRPRLAQVKSEYDKVLRQRGALLKSLGAAKRRGRILDFTALDVWDMQLAHLGAQLTAARAAIISRLREPVSRYYREVSGADDDARIDYRASADHGVFTLPTAADLHTDEENGEKAARAQHLVAEHENDLQDAELVEVQLLSNLAARRNEEIDRGVNLVGPHRDEMVLSLGTLPARGYASHGESWSYALALRLATWHVLRSDESGQWSDDNEPLLLLDDVFAELDSRRRRRLAELVTQAQQVIITAAVGDDLPETLGGARFYVHAGVVEGAGSAKDAGIVARAGIAGSPEGPVVAESADAVPGGADLPQQAPAGVVETKNRRNPAVNDRAGDGDSSAGVR